MVADVHSHILPGVDDGSACVDESIAMLQAMKSQGIQKVIATPHFYPGMDNPEEFLARRAEAMDRLSEAISGLPDMPQILLGAEVYYYPEMSNSESLKRLTMGGSRYIMVELPQSPWPDRIYQELVRIRENQGLIPIVAHVDRYIGRFRTFGIPQRLAELPVLVQANAEFFLQKSTSSMAFRMLKQNSIHLLGSDCHNLDSRKPNLRAALELIERRMGAAPLAAIQESQAYALQNE